MIFKRKIIITTACITAAVSLLLAENSSIDNALNNAAVEQQERELKVSYLLQKANNNFLSKKYDKAADRYLTAISILSNTHPTTGKNKKRINEVRNSLALVYSNWAESLLNQASIESNNGDIDKAMELTKEAAKINPKLKDRVNQIQKQLRLKRAKLKFADISTDKEHKKLDEQKNYNLSVLYEQAKILYRKHDYDNAKSKLEEIIAIDPYDSKAIYYLNLLNRKIYDTGTDRKEEASDKRIGEVIWNSVQPDQTKSIKGERIDVENQTASKISKHDEDTSLEHKLNELIVPHISFDDVPVKDALMFLQEESKKIDPSGEGINLVIEIAEPNVSQENQEAVEDEEDTSSQAQNPNLYNVTLTESNIPLRTAIEHICEDAGVHFSVKKYAVFVSNTLIGNARLITKVFPADREKFGTILIDATVTPSTAVDLTDYFKARDINFPSGSSAVYDLRISRVIVRNTPEEIVKIQNHLEKLASTITPQVSIASKFIEVAQTDFDELGFEWAISKSNSNVSFPELSDANRSAYSSAIGNNAAGTPDRMFKLAVTQKNWDIAATLHALSQSSKSESLASPRVTTLNGYTTVIRVVTERYFPESWTEPEIVETTANDATTNWLISTVPEFGDVTDIGIVFKVTPFVCSDNYSIDLVLEPVVQKFVGYNDNYTYTANLEVSDGNNGSVVPVTYTQKMPIIANRSIKTRLRVYDGDTVVMGGALEDSTTKYNDKIPMMGDVPLVGRFFQSEIEDTEKTNLLIFTTVHLITSDGTLLRPLKRDGRPAFPDRF